MTYMEEDWEDNDTLNNHPGIIIPEHPKNPEHHLKLGTTPKIPRKAQNLKKLTNKIKIKK